MVADDAIEPRLEPEAATEPSFSEKARLYNGPSHGERLASSRRGYREREVRTVRSLVCGPSPGARAARRRPARDDRHRSPQVLVVEGEPGIGKTRLVRELGEIARASAPGGTIFQGHCLPGGPGVSNWAPAEMLRRAFGIGSDLPTGELDAAFVGAVARAVEPLGMSQRDVVRTAQALATSAGILLPGNAYDRAEPRDVQAAILRAWSRLFDAYARRGSTVVLLEDIQWAGAALRMLIAGLVPTLVGPVLHVVTTRPGLREQHPGFLDGPGLEWVSLAPIKVDESEALVLGLLDGPRLGAELSSTIIARAEGNPFFIEETVRHLIETGVLRRRGRMARWEPPSDPGVPSPWPRS